MVHRAGDICTVAYHAFLTVSCTAHHTNDMAHVIAVYSSTCVMCSGERSIFFYCNGSFRPFRFGYFLIRPSHSQEQVVLSSRVMRVSFVFHFTYCKSSASTAFWNGTFFDGLISVSILIGRSARATPSCFDSLISVPFWTSDPLKSKFFVYGGFYDGFILVRWSQCATYGVWQFHIGFISLRWSSTANIVCVGRFHIGFISMRWSSWSTLFFVWRFHFVSVSFREFHRFFYFSYFYSFLFFILRFFSPCSMRFLFVFFNRFFIRFFLLEF